jgi:hypothetical protein
LQSAQFIPQGAINVDFIDFDITGYRTAIQAFEIARSNSGRTVSSSSFSTTSTESNALPGYFSPCFPFGKDTFSQTLRLILIYRSPAGHQGNAINPGGHIPGNKTVRDITTDQFRVPLDGVAVAASSCGNGYMDVPGQEPGHRFGLQYLPGWSLKILHTRWDCAPFEEFKYIGPA